MPHTEEKIVARRKWQREAYAKNPAKFAERQRRWKAANRDTSSLMARTWNARNPKRTIFAYKRRAARTAGIEFTLEYDAIVWPEVCPVFGMSMRYERGVKGQAGPRDDSPSFDRLDPAKGYVPGNVVIVSVRANRIKGNTTPQEFQQLLAYYTSRV